VPARKPHPVVFGILIVPFGVLGGYLSVAVGYQLRQAGISVEQIAGLVAAGLAPHTWKFAWAPIADTTLSRKAWYWISAIVVALGIFATGALPATGASLPLLGLVILVSNIASTFMGMAAEILLAYGTDEHEKGRAGGWYQAGNLGGNGIGGGAGLWLSQALPAPWMASALIAMLCLACGLVLFLLPEPPKAHAGGGLKASLAHVGRDLWVMAKQQRGFIALVLCFLPLGSGAASGLFAAIAPEWRASSDAVALATGVGSGVLSAIGCVAGGWWCDRMDRKSAYAVFGVLQASCAVAMALSPHDQTTYVLWTSVYAFITGLTYAGFTAFVLEAMGLGAAATKYNVFASLSNMPILYMTNIDGWAHTRFGAGGMLLTEAAFGALGLTLFVLLVTLTRRYGRWSTAAA
jgi:MFS family permease